MPKPPKLSEKVENAKITPEQVDEVVEGKCMTVRELAEELKYSTDWVAQHIREGRIAAVKPLGGRWRIPMSEVKRIKEVGSPRLPKKPKPEESGEITVDSHHMKRMKGPERKEKSEKRGLLDILLGSEE